MTILIADDFAPVRSSLKRMLESLPSVEQVAEAADGKEAQQLIGILQPNILILDVQMPEKTGIDLLREMGNSLQHTTVIILTNYATPELRSQCLSLGADHVLDKTLEFQHVVEIVQQIALA
jgi:DNA-binding NarL/FixJ family response regulator